MRTAAFTVISTPRDFHIRAGWLHVIIWRQSRGVWAAGIIEGCPCLDTPLARVYLK